MIKHHYFYAWRRGNMQLVKYLKDHGANKYIKIYIYIYIFDKEYFSSNTFKSMVSDPPLKW